MPSPALLIALALVVIGIGALVAFWLATLGDRRDPRERPRRSGRYRRRAEAKPPWWRGLWDSWWNAWWLPTTWVLTTLAGISILLAIMRLPPR